MEVFPVPSSPITRILYRCSFFSGFPAYNNIQQRYQTGKDFLAYNIRQRYEAGKDFLPTTKIWGREGFLAYNIQQRYQTGKEFLPTTYSKDIRHGRISWLQNLTISSMVGCPFSTYNKDIRQGRIFFQQHTTKISGREGYPAYNIQQRYQAWQDILPTKFNNIKNGRMPFLNIQQRYQRYRALLDILPTT